MESVVVVSVIVVSVGVGCVPGVATESVLPEVLCVELHPITATEAAKSTISIFVFIFSRF